MKPRLLIPLAVTAIALAGCGSSSTSESAGAEASESSSSSATATASTEATDAASEPTAGADAGADAAATPQPTTGQGEQPTGANAVSFGDCSAEYIELTTALLPGDVASPEQLEAWEQQYQNASQAYAEGDAQEAAAVCQQLLADIDQTLSRG